MISDGCGGELSCEFCGNPTPICTDNICQACTSTTQCASGEICDSGLCETCNVCADGCGLTSVQAAIDTASSDDTVRICVGTYGHGPGSPVARIDQNLTLVGAGAEAMILEGGDTAQVVQIGNVAVTLRDLTIKNGYGHFGGGISNVGTLILSRVDVTDNLATYGGGGFSTLFASVSVDFDAVICSNTPLIDQYGGASPAPVPLRARSAHDGGLAHQGAICGVR